MDYIVILINQADKNIVNEEIELRNFAASKKISIYTVFYDESPQKAELKEREKFLEFLKNLRDEDRLIISSIETLGWRVGELVQIIAKIFSKGSEILCVDNNERLYSNMPAGILLSKLSLTRAKNIKKGISKLGRPEGSRSKSKYDAYLPQIVQFLKTSRNISALARQLDISRTSLKDYISSRRL